MSNPAIVLFMPVFSDHLVQNGGYIPDKPEACALFYYYLLARKAYEETENAIVLEGDPDPTANFKQLYTSVAFIFGVNPEKMGYYWEPVDRECKRADLPLLKLNLRMTGVRLTH